MGNCSSTSSAIITNNISNKINYNLICGELFVRIKDNLGNYIELLQSHYFSLPDNTEYQYEFVNTGRTNADIMVEIDGNLEIFVRIDAGTTITIDRPTTVKQKFLFKSTKALHGNNINNNNLNGQIKITFCPEIVKPNYSKSTITTEETKQSTSKLTGTTGYVPDLSSNFYGGSTILGNDSNTIYFQVTPITEYDDKRKAIVEARLVSKII